MLFGNERKELLRLRRENAELNRKCNSLERKVEDKKRSIWIVRRDLERSEEKLKIAKKECMRLARINKEKMREE